MGLTDRLVRGLMPLVPRPLVWTVARRYVAGADVRDAVRRIKALRADGFGTIIDVLGEGIASLDEARAAAQEYIRALDALRSVDPDCPISVKPTHLGLSLDRDVCAELLDDLCRRAAAESRRVRFEMEDAPTIDGTLDVFEEVAKRRDNIGCVLQSRLFRTAKDVERLLRSVPALDVRLVKGIYLEPESIAWTEGPDISRSYVELARALLDGGARLGLATHDDEVARACEQLIAERGLDSPPTAQRTYEFQCLMGVRRRFAEALRDGGHRVRIYVPYGKDWHAYSMRRMGKNPDIARHVIRAAFGREG